MLKKSLVAGLILFAFGSLAHALCSSPLVWDGIVKTNVDKDGYVNYDNIRINKGGDLYEFISSIESADLKSCTETEKLAFWINAYNAHIVRMILARPQLKKISEDFSLLDEKFRVARISISLNDIEGRIIRSNLKKGGPIDNFSIKTPDPRAAFAIVPGAIDSPRLLNRAYQGATLDAALQAAAVAFANNPKYLRIEDGKLVSSNLLKWYEEDFQAKGGVATYFSKLLDPKLRRDAGEVDKKLVSDFPAKTDFRYDWTINSARNKPVAAQ